MSATQQEKAIGLTWRIRPNGDRVPYWRARRDLIKAGYRPKNVRLHYVPDDPALIARCHVLQAEMLEWATSSGRGRAVAYDGSFASLVRLYETHPDSPYFDLHEKTQINYSTTLALLMRHKGKRLVANVTGADVRRWYKELVEAKSQHWAYYTINVLKTALSFGSTQRIGECRILRQELRDTRFRSGARRREHLTYAQVRAFCDKARELDYPWMARCLTLQFDFGMRRRDVIGEYITDENSEHGIRIGKRVWRDGLTWAHIGDDRIVRKLISKTAKTSGLTAVHAIDDYPDAAADLALTPSEQRIGPLVIDPHTGKPPTFDRCRHVFRLIARAAGIPDDIRMMDARAGASTEAYEAGVSEEEAMALTTHTERKTNRGYLRDLTEQSRRAAAKRVASRKEQGT